MFFGRMENEMDLESKGSSSFVPTGGLQSTRLQYPIEEGLCFQKKMTYPESNPYPRQSYRVPTNHCLLDVMLRCVRFPLPLFSRGAVPLFAGLRGLWVQTEHLSPKPLLIYKVQNPSVSRRG